MSNAKIIPVAFASREVLTSPEVVASARRAAVTLARHADRAVRIRFFRGVGGAFVRGDYRLGISVGLYPAVRPRALGEDLREWQERRDAAARAVVVVDVMADAEWLTDGALADQGDFGAEYAAPEFSDVAAAAGWIRENCRRAPVARVSAADLAEWTQRNVTVARNTRVTLAEAVKIYGSLYRGKIRAATLVANHRISPEDAGAIEAAVRKILPKGRMT